MNALRLLPLAALLLVPLVALVPACLPTTDGGSSSSSSSGSVDGGGDSDVDPARAAQCDAYAQAAAQCCAASPGECGTTSAARYRDYCLGYARTCPAMPTCFSGGDCNTLLYCSGGC